MRDANRNLAKFAPAGQRRTAAAAARAALIVADAAAAAAAAATDAVAQRPLNPLLGATEPEQELGEAVGKPTGATATREALPKVCHSTATEPEQELGGAVGKLAGATAPREALPKLFHTTATREALLKICHSSQQKIQPSHLGPQRTSGRHQFVASQPWAVPNHARKAPAVSGWTRVQHGNANSPIIPTALLPPKPPTGPVPATLDAHIARDASLFKKLGWRAFVKQRRTTSDFASLDNVDHLAQRLLKFYKERGAPVKLSTKPWSQDKITTALARGAHWSCRDHLDFLHEEFGDMIEKSQWVILPVADVAHLPGLRISPPGVIPQRDRRPRWICDYTWLQVNEETLPLAALEAMQFGHALDRILREIIIADPSLGPVQLLKVDLSDGFYRVNLNIDC